MKKKKPIKYVWRNDKSNIKKWNNINEEEIVMKSNKQ